MSKATDKWNRQKWEQETVKDFQKMVRYESANDQGIIKCVSCPATGHWKNTDNRFDAGHFFSRRHANTKFNEMNCWPQCVTCNRYRNGNYRDYTIWFIDRFGRDELDRLQAQSKVIRGPWKIHELQLMRVEYRRRWKEAQEKLESIGL